MTDREYKEAINCIVNSGRGFMAILDLTKMMEMYTNNVKLVMKEMKAEKKAVIKIVKSNSVTVKDKLKAVENLFM